MTTETASATTETAPPTVGQLRHKAELPLLIIAGVLTIIGVIGVIVVLLSGAELTSTGQTVLIGLATPLLAGLFIIRYAYWKAIVNSVEITGRQLPEIFAIYNQLGSDMGVTPLPRLYLGNGNGTLNAYASKCQVKKSYVVIWSDLVEIAYELDDFDGVKFVLAHELGHVKCGHVDLWRQAIMAIPRVLLIGRSVTRAQEYTADRCGSYYAPSGAKSMMVLFSGKHMYQRCNIAAFQQSVHSHHDGFWMKFSNFMADHPVGWRRMQPLADVETKGWDQHGKML